MVRIANLLVPALAGRVAAVAEARADEGKSSVAHVHCWPQYRQAKGPSRTAAPFLARSPDNGNPSQAQGPTARANGNSCLSLESAVDALVASIRTGKTADILKVLGADAKKIVSSGDDTSDRAARQLFLSAYDESHRTSTPSDSQATLIVGKDDFPFPIPLVKKTGCWQFDVKAGKQEILDRRIGNNELRAIETMHAYVDAQYEYASEDRDGKGDQYAQKLLSSEGKRDGLYWPVHEGEAESPLGSLIAGARAEGYAARSAAPAPYHGYVFRILKAQGQEAAGGAMDYVAGGRMIGGFGLVAVPAEYGNSGVMTFIVNHDDKVFQKDLGPETAALAAQIKEFDPDATSAAVAEPQKKGDP
jgi:hypothetical protein